jgi:phage portal protein BeeE
LPDSLKSRSDKIEPLENHALLQLVAKPNSYMTSSALWQCVVFSLEATGRAYLWMPEDSDKPALHYLPPHWVEPNHQHGLFASFKVRPPHAAEGFEVPGDEMCMISIPDPEDPLSSLSKLSANGIAVTIDEKIQASQYQAFDHGITPRHALRVGGLPDQHGVINKHNMPVLTRPQRKQFIEAIKQVYSGVHNSGHPFIIDGLISDIFKVSNSPNEMDWLDSSSLTKSRLFESFSVHPFISGAELNVGGYAQAAVIIRAFADNVVNPLACNIAEAFTNQIAPRFASKGQKLVCWFARSDEIDPELVLKRWQLACRSKAVTVNELRTVLLNLDEIPDGDQLVGAVDDFADGLEQQADAIAASVFSRNGRAHA